MSSLPCPTLLRRLPPQKNAHSWRCSSSSSSVALGLECCSSETGSEPKYFSLGYRDATMKPGPAWTIDALPCTQHTHFSLMTSFSGLLWSSRCIIRGWGRHSAQLISPLPRKSKTTPVRYGRAARPMPERINNLSVLPLLKKHFPSSAVFIAHDARLPRSRFPIRFPARYNRVYQLLASLLHKSFSSFAVSQQTA
jgi:hypothetical protein